MDFSLSTALKLTQNLSPQMLQSLELLRMNSEELEAFIKEQIEKNPALIIPEKTYREVSFDSDASDRKQAFLESIPQKGESLIEHLTVQLGESEVPPEIRRICELLIGNTDENGFFIVPVPELTEGFEKDDVAKALGLVQTFEPCGVCTSDFRESLILQAKDLGLKDRDLEIFTSLVNDHLEDLAQSRERLIAKSLRITGEELEDYIGVLHSLNPYPGRLYSSSDDSFVIPDFAIHYIDGELCLTFNEMSFPTLEIDPEFSSLTQSPDRETRSYVSDYVRKAKGLVSMVNMRGETLRKTASVLLDRQRDFFIEGPKALRTLTLKDVADLVGVHETTISRLSQGKFVETDFGIFELKYFFSQGVGDVSRNAVKEQIKEIRAENPKLSAQKISDILSERGISCARRTVAKYLAELDI